MAGLGVSVALFGLAPQAIRSDGEGFASPYVWHQLEYNPFNLNHSALQLEMCLGLLLGMAARAGALRRGLRLFLCLPAALNGAGHLDALGRSAHNPRALFRQTQRGGNGGNLTSSGGERCR